MNKDPMQLSAILNIEHVRNSGLLHDFQLQENHTTRHSATQSKLMIVMRCEKRKNEKARRNGQGREGAMRKTSTLSLHKQGTAKQWILSCVIQHLSCPDGGSAFTQPSAHSFEELCRKEVITVHQPSL